MGSKSSKKKLKDIYGKNLIYANIVMKHLNQQHY